MKNHNMDHKKPKKINLLKFKIVLVYFILENKVS